MNKVTEVLDWKMLYLENSEQMFAKERYDVKCIFPSVSICLS